MFEDNKYSNQFSRHYLTENLRLHLHDNDVCLNLMLQPESDNDYIKSKQLSDLTVPWTTNKFTAGVITIPRQHFNTKARFDQCDETFFSPWIGQEQFTPVGNIVRFREVLETGTRPQHHHQNRNSSSIPWFLTKVESVQPILPSDSLPQSPGHGDTSRFQYKSYPHPFDGLPRMSRNEFVIHWPFDLSKNIRLVVRAVSESVRQFWCSPQWTVYSETTLDMYNDVLCSPYWLTESQVLIVSVLPTRALSIYSHATESI